jgi:hydrogenase maturation protein HypF
MPGGERAIAEPWRMACSWLTAIGAERPPALEAIDGERWQVVARLAASGMGSPVTSSAGRLFAAVAAMCGVRLQVSYEGQAAIELEALADLAAAEPYPLALADGPPIVLDPRPAIEAILADLAGEVPVAAISARLHAGVARATADACARAAARAGVATAVLSGGVFQNRLLLRLTAAALEEAGLRVLVPRLLPPNDGQIALGQVAVAAAQLGR